MPVELEQVHEGMEVLSADGALVGTVQKVYPQPGLDAGGLEARRPAAYIKVRRVGAGYLYVPLDGLREVHQGRVVLSVPLGEIDNTNWVFRPLAVPPE